MVLGSQKPPIHLLLLAKRIRCATSGFSNNFANKTDLNGVNGTTICREKNGQWYYNRIKICTSLQQFSLNFWEVRTFLQRKKWIREASPHSNLASLVVSSTEPINALKIIVFFGGKVSDGFSVQEMHELWLSGNEWNRERGGRNATFYKARSECQTVHKKNAKIKAILKLSRWGKII